MQSGNYHFNVEHIAFLERSREQPLRKILTLANGVPSFAADILSRRYGLELARVGRELKRRTRRGW